MFYPLPADTVFEAKKRARSRTRLLLALLCTIYAAGFNLLAAGLFLAEFNRPVQGEPFSIPLEVHVWACVGALLSAAFHFVWAKSKSLDDMLKKLGARDADPSDEAHRRFINLTQEAAVAIGRGAVRAVVIPTPALNAFSVDGSGGDCAIGATEGLLAQLTRSELESVVAHEAAHLAHGDSRLLSIACSLFSVFDILSRVRVRGRGRGAAGLLVFWLVAQCGRFLTQIIYLAISRNREYYADSEAVHLCKNPLALAGALQKISTRDRGYLAVPDGFSAVFILNPALCAVDEARGVAADWLSTHPPVDSRVEILMGWARKEMPVVGAEKPGALPIFVHDEDRWSGPVMTPEAEKMGLRPETWVADGAQIVPAVSHPALKGLFGDFGAAAGTGRQCPRCATPLVVEIYEGISVERCSWCNGRLLPADGIQRAVLRRQAAFASAQIDDVAQWRKMQRGTLKDVCQLPHIKCPRCQSPMIKRFHTEVTRVVIDACMNASCGSVWCDPGELEKIQMIIERYDSGGV